MREFLRWVRLHIPGIGFAKRVLRKLHGALVRAAKGTESLAFEAQTYLYLVFVIFGVAIADCARTGRYSFGSLFVAPTITTVLIISAYVVRRLRAKEPFREQTRRLDGRCRADADPYLATLDIRGDSCVDKINFSLGFKEVPKEAESVLLILHQNRGRWVDRKFLYTVESMLRQIADLEFRDKDGVEKIKWVCFVCRDGSFAAYQPFNKFRTQIKLGNTQYAVLLNQKTSKDFHEKIRGYREEEEKLKCGDAHEPDIITGLEVRTLPEVSAAKPLTNRQALLRLTSQGQSEAMLVTAAEHKPLGIVSLNALLNCTLVGVFPSPDKEDIDKKQREVKSPCPLTETEELKCQTPPAVDPGNDNLKRGAVLEPIPTHIPQEIGNFRVTRP